MQRLENVCCVRLQTGDARHFLIVMCDACPYNTIKSHRGDSFEEVVQHIFSDRSNHLQFQVNHSSLGDPERFSFFLEMLRRQVNCCFVQTRSSINSECGRRGPFSYNQGKNHTIVTCVSASGFALPPMLIHPGSLICTCALDSFHLHNTGLQINIFLLINCLASQLTV